MYLPGKDAKVSLLPNLIRGVAFLLVMLLGLWGVGAGQKKTKPEGTYKEWLERDVAYLITREERDAFLHLDNDQSRDKFIESFWELRNPTPGSPTNSFKEEHYQRLAYANDHFGHESGNSGWRTAMGRTYIVLGPPQQKSNYHDSQDLRPMEVWFYSNAHPALPPFFYVVFYREDNFSEYKLYSPYFDGPQKLVTQRGETRVQAWKTIDKSGGRELARIALSLVPDEPVDTQNATSGLQSDLMLGILRDLANHPFSVEQLNIRRLNASVSSSVVSQGESLGVLAVPLRDSEGRTRVDYQLRLSKPEDLSLAETSADRYYLKIGVRANVYGLDKKLLFTQERSYTKNVSRVQFERVKSRVFGFQGSLPLPPGNYHVEWQFTDQLKKVSYRTQQDVTIPKIPVTGLAVTEMVPFRTAQTVTDAHADAVPFSFGGVKFTPLLKRETSFSAGGQIKLFYQIWTAPPDASTQDEKLKVSYTYGRPGARQDTQTIVDEISKAQFDANGSLINGKEIPIGDWASGNYRLVLSLQDQQSKKETYSSLSFRVEPAAAPPASWDIDDSEDTSKEAGTGVLDYERGVCYLALGENELARHAFRSALEKDPRSYKTLATLVDAEYSLQAFGEVAKYAGRVEVTAQTEERTILRIAESFDKIGDTKRAAEFLESTVKVKPASGPIYLTLAEYYQRLGNPKKSEEYEVRGKTLMNKTSPTVSP